MLVLGANAATAPASGRPSAQTTTTLEVIVTGVGDDPNDPTIPAVNCSFGAAKTPCEPVNVPAGDPCRVTQVRGDAHGCQYTVEQGQTVTLEPVSTAPGFVNWSVFECEKTGACTITMDSDRMVVATWTPTTLDVAAAFGSSDEKVTVENSKREVVFVCSASDGGATCSGQLDAFEDVTLSAEPAAKFEGWKGFNGDPPETPNSTLAACADVVGPSCTYTLSGNDVIAAKFEDAPDPINVVPPRKLIPLRVVVEPKGVGRVTSSRSRVSEAIECGSTCRAKFEQDEKPRLTAEPLGRAKFVGWRGGAPYCTSNQTCRYPAYRMTSVKAVFSPAPPPPPPPPPPSPPPPPGACQRLQVGTARPDRLDGGAGGDRIYGRAGGDRIRGRGGNDCLYGGRGNDMLSGGRGNDLLDGGRGSDKLNGGPGTDVMKGGSGRDVIGARDGVRDRISCGPGRDVARVDALDKVARGCEVIRRR
jgi:hypothetical protein